MKKKNGNNIYNKNKNISNINPNSQIKNKNPIRKNEEEKNVNKIKETKDRPGTKESRQIKRKIEKNSVDFINIKNEPKNNYKKNTNFQRKKLNSQNKIRIKSNPENYKNNFEIKKKNSNPIEKIEFSDNNKILKILMPKVNIINKNQGQNNNLILNINKRKSQVKNDKKESNLEKRNNKSDSLTFFSINFKCSPQVPLENYGKTSYINSVFQCLGNIECISFYYLSNKELFVEYHNEIFLVSFLFSRLVIHLFPNSEEDYKKPYSLKKIYNNILALNPIFKGKSTKNAIDFLLYFLNELHEEEKKFLNQDKNLKNYNNINEKNLINYINYLIYLNNTKDSKTQIYKAFSWINKKIETCWECKTENINFQFYFTYDLEFENVLNKAIINYKNEISIFDCIKYTTEPTNLYNTFCKNCNKKNNFTKISNIYSCQNMLILLIRGIEKKETCENIKNNNIKIKIDNFLDLTNVIENKNSNKVFSLYGLIFFDSVNLEYIAFSISPIDQKWYRYINKECRLVELKDFINLSDNNKIFPAILFYKANK